MHQTPNGAVRRSPRGYGAPLPPREAAAGAGQRRTPHWASNLPRMSADVNTNSPVGTPRRSGDVAWIVDVTRRPRMPWAMEARFEQRGAAMNDQGGLDGCRHAARCTETQALHVQPVAPSDSKSARDVVAEMC